MKTSQYNKRVTIQEYTSTKNSRGIAQQKWNDIKKVWANINTNIENEENIANSIKSKRNNEITIRYNELLEEKLSNTEKYRIFYKRPYNILGIENVEEQNIELKIRCEATNNE
jgi:SPP1 family predicted phage head-tail adaptor